MTATFDLDRLLDDVLREHGPNDAPPSFADQAIAAASAVSQSPVRIAALDRRTWPARFGGRSLAPDGRRLALIALAVLLVLVSAFALAGAWKPAIKGVFVEGPSLPGTGLIMNAVALPDGRVVVAVDGVYGTVPGTTTLDCSRPCRPHLKILDARTGTFRDARDLPPSTKVESLTLLHDGRVLIVNSSRRTADGPSAAIYDPVADRFESVGDPVDSRFSAAFLVTLDDGRVLVGGGRDVDGALASVELFDPTTGTFARTGPMNRGRIEGASATLLDDGRVLVVGGGPEVGTSAELYDPETGTFTPTGDTTVARGGLHSATRLQDGRVLIAGGLVPFDGEPERVPDVTGTAEIYDPATGSFSPVGSMAAPRALHTAALLSDGTVLVAGGIRGIRENGAPDLVADAEIYDPGTGTFRATGSPIHLRLGAKAVSIDGRVLVLGDFDPTGDDPTTGAATEWFE